jgi:glycerophosphoryl diester phosphodiesterase
MGAVAYNPGKDAIRPGDITAIREAGVDVNVWTVNDPALMRTLIENHVSGIFTDFPQVLKEMLISGF